MPQFYYYYYYYYLGLSVDCIRLQTHTVHISTRAARRTLRHKNDDIMHYGSEENKCQSVMHAHRETKNMENR